MIKTILAVQAVILAALLLLAVDLYAHKRVEMVGGVNIWGYRGAVVKRRAPREARVLLLGGIRAWGYGAAAQDTIAYALGWELTVQTQRQTTVIDAARIGATAPDYAAAVTRHAGLEADVVVLYDDLGFAATKPGNSWIAGAFRGYEPVLPIVMEEKGIFLQQRESAVWRLIGGTLQLAGHMLNELESIDAAPAPGDYASHMIAAADRALPFAIVLIVVDAPVTEVQEQNLRALRDRIAQRADPRLKLRQLTEVADPSELLDGYSYGAVARGRVTRAILPELLALSQIRKPS